MGWGLLPNVGPACVTCAKRSIDVIHAIGTWDNKPLFGRKSKHQMPLANSSEVRYKLAAECKPCFSDTHHISQGKPDLPLAKRHLQRFCTVPATHAFARVGCARMSRFFLKGARNPHSTGRCPAGLRSSGGEKVRQAACAPSPPSLARLASRSLQIGGHRRPMPPRGGVHSGARDVHLATRDGPVAPGKSRIDAPFRGGHDRRHLWRDPLRLAHTSRSCSHLSFVVLPRPSWSCLPSPSFPSSSFNTPVIR